MQSGVSIEDPEFPLQTGVPRAEVCSYSDIRGSGYCVLYAENCCSMYAVHPN